MSVQNPIFGLHSSRAIQIIDESPIDFKFIAVTKDKTIKHNNTDTKKKESTLDTDRLRFHHLAKCLVKGGKFRIIIAFHF